MVMKQNIPVKLISEALRNFLSCVWEKSVKILVCFKMWSQSVVTVPHDRLTLRHCATCWKTQWAWTLLPQP